MRPKDLKFPFAWDDRQPMVHDGVLVVPRFYDQHHNFSLKSHLYVDLPISVEYCSGNGDWVIERAQRDQNRFWIAVEKQFCRVRKIWSKMQNQNIANLFIVCGEALTFTQHYLWENALDEIFVNFPDPWPKVRHAKHRLVQKPFVEALSLAVKPGGKATYATDHRRYALQIIDQMQEHPLWQSIFPQPYYIDQFENYGRSWFGDLFEDKGESLHFIQYRAL